MTQKEFWSKIKKSFREDSFEEGDILCNCIHDTCINHSNEKLTCIYFNKNLAIKERFPCAYFTNHFQNELDFRRKLLKNFPFLLLEEEINEN